MADQNQCAMWNCESIADRRRAQATCNVVFGQQTNAIAKNGNRAVRAEAGREGAAAEAEAVRVAVVVDQRQKPGNARDPLPQTMRE